MKRINHDIHFSWQAQYLVKFKCHFFGAGAVFGEIWNDSRSAKCCIFQYKMLVVGVKSNLGCEAVCGLTASFSERSRIMVGTVSDRPRIVNDVSSVLDKFLRNFRESFCVAGAVFGEVGQ